MLTKKTLCVICHLVIVMTVVFTFTGTALAEYVHGRFKYNLEDGSITITGYTGSDKVVTVPASIAGNPVNTIGKGAFKNSLDVVLIRVYSSVVDVQEGALAPGQTIEYIPNDGMPLDESNADGVQGDSRSEQTTSGEGEGTQESSSQSGEDDSNESTAQSAQNKGDATSTELTAMPLGIRLKDGSFVTVDYNGNLVLVDINGNERLLDNTQTYMREATEDGHVVIRDASGKAVEVDSEANTVSYVSKDGRPMKFNSVQKTTEVTDEDGDVYVVEDADVEDATVTKEEPRISEQNNHAQQTPVVAAVIVLVVVACVAAFCVWRSKRRQG